MTHKPKLNLAAIRNRAYAAKDGLVQTGYEMNCNWEPARWLAFVSADHPNADANAEFLAHAKRDILVLLDEVERLRGVV